MCHLKSPEDGQFWRLTLSVYPKKDIGKTILSSIDFQVSLSLLSQTDNNRMTNRSVQCQCRQQLSFPNPLTGLPPEVLCLQLGHQPDHGGLWLVFSWLETASPVPLEFSSVTLLESPFFFLQMKINPIASIIGDGLAHSVQ